jgi:hypothetical protein
VPLSTLAAATDKLVAAMEPKRKLAAPNAAVRALGEGRLAGRLAGRPGSCL